MMSIELAQATVAEKGALEKGREAVCILHGWNCREHGLHGARLSWTHYQSDA